MISVVNAGVLAIAYEEDGPRDGWPVVLAHGFPYDVRAYDEVAARLVLEGARVIRPYQRGFGLTRFRDDATPRVGQQAALGADLAALLDALRLEAPIVAGFDWGGLAACVATALWPAQIAGLVSMAGYDVIDIAAMRRPAKPALGFVGIHRELMTAAAR